MPKIQEILKDYLGDIEVGTHLNGDESMAKGAAFYAANFSSNFRVRPIQLSDGLNIEANCHGETLELEDIWEVEEIIPEPEELIDEGIPEEFIINLEEHLKESVE